MATFHENITSSTPSSDNAAFSGDLGDGETTKWFIFPPGTIQVGVDITPAGTAKVQTSNDITKMQDNTETGIDWDDGEVAIQVGRVAWAVRGFRVVSVSGAVRYSFNGIFK